MALPFSEFARDMREIVDKTRDSLAEPYRNAVSERHRAAFDVAPVGSMNELGPSIIATEVFGITQDGFYWGTPLDYARDYAEYRESSIGEPLLYADPILADAIWTIWSEHVFSEFE